MTPIQRLTNGNIVLTLTIPASDIAKQYELEVQKAVETTELPGFRKGKAPRDLVEPKLDSTHLYNHAVQELLPNLYAKALKEHALKPVLHPQLKLISGSQSQDWVFEAVTCEFPSITLPELKIPKSPKDLATNDEKLSYVLDWLRKQLNIQIPDVLIEEEANHRLASLVQNLTQLGMTVESYLQAKKLTLEQLKGDTASQGRADLEIEVILQAYQEKEGLKDRKSTLEHLQSLV